MAHPIPPVPFPGFWPLLLLQGPSGNGFSYAVLAAVHALASAAWFGAMFYSLTVLHPRARLFLKTDEEFEEFIATVSRGARWKVLAAFAFIGISGAALAALSLLHGSAAATPRWWLLVAGKSVAITAALGVFCHASWRLWPARIFAVPSELPAVRRRFRRVAVTLLALAAAGIVLGVWLHL